METLVLDLPSVEESEIARRYGKQVGRGAFRSVHRVNGTRWAYKFERTDEDCYMSPGANRVEMANYLKWRNRLPEGVDFPEMVMLDNGAIAVEYVNGMLAKDAHPKWNECDCPSFGIPRCWKEMVATVKLQDLHGRNVMIDRKARKVYIVDIGEYGND